MTVIRCKLRIAALDLNDDQAEEFLESYNPLVLARLENYYMVYG